MKDIYLVIDNVRSLLNVGAIFRLADAAGVKEVYLCGISGVQKIGTKVWLHPRLEKTALAAFSSVSWKYVDSTEEAVTELKSKGVSVVAIELTPKSKDYLAMRYKAPIALLVGHETGGVTDAVLHQCDDVVEIPMQGAGKSLNVATSLAIVLYEVLRQQSFYSSSDEGVEKSI